MKDTAVQIQEFLIDMRRTVRREIVVGLLMLPYFAFFLVILPMDTRMFYGFLLIELAILFELGMMFFVVRARGDLYSHPPEDLAHWKAEIRRQASLRRWVPLWYLAPFMVGFLVLLWPTSGTPWLLPAMLWFIIGLYALITWLNVRAARELEQTAATLGEPEKPAAASCANESPEAAMNSSQDKRYWFAAKRYGYGWGAATCWQGWAVYLGYAVLLPAAGILLLRPGRGEGLFFGAMAGLTILLIIICYLKGEPARWRWGR